jgi:hypothetical protein
MLKHLHQIGNIPKTPFLLASAWYYEQAQDGKTSSVFDFTLRSCGFRTAKNSKFSETVTIYLNFDRLRETELRLPRRPGILQRSRVLPV